jgi:hypothetical protein
MPGKPFVDPGMSQRFSLLAVATDDLSGHFNVPRMNGYDPLIALNPHSDGVSYSLVVHVLQMDCTCWKLDNLIATL